VLNWEWIVVETTQVWRSDSL